LEKLFLAIVLFALAASTACATMFVSQDTPERDPAGAL
jgi:hypothetical protein